MALLVGPPAALVAILLAAAWGLARLGRRPGARRSWPVWIAAVSCLVLAAVFAFVAVFHAVTA